MDDSRILIFEALRVKFLDFITALKAMPASPMQKQQAFIRLDEGHMWMQNAVLSYNAPAVQPPMENPTPPVEINEVNQPPIEQPETPV